MTAEKCKKPTYEICRAVNEVEAPEDLRQNLSYFSPNREMPLNRYKISNDDGSFFYISRQSNSCGVINLSFIACLNSGWYEEAFILFDRLVKHLNYSFATYYTNQNQRDLADALAKAGWTPQDAGTNRRTGNQITLWTKRYDK